MKTKRSFIIWGTIFLIQSIFAWETLADEKIRWDLDKPGEVRGVKNFKDYRVEDGFFVGTTEWNPYFSLALPEKEISAEKFNFLTMRLFSSTGADALLVYYYGPSGDWCLGHTRIPIVSGWALYNVDLSRVDWKAAAASGPEARKWGGREGKISIFRIDPGNQEDRDVKIDWIELKKGGEGHGVIPEETKPETSMKWGICGDSLSSWTMYGAKESRVTDAGGIEGLMWDATVIQSPPIAWLAKDVKAIEIGWFAGEEPGFLQMSWTAKYEGGDICTGSVSSGILPNGWQTLLFDVEREPWWKGTITSLTFRVNAADRNPDKMALAYLRALPTSNIIPNADRVARIPDKTGGLFGEWKQDKGHWSVPIHRILPRTTYVLEVMGKNPPVYELEILDRFGEILSTVDRSSSKEFITPEQTVTARLIIKTDILDKETVPLLTVTKPAPLLRKGPWWKANWIWSQIREDSRRTVWFRRVFALKELPSRGEILITSDDAYKLWINEKFIGEDSNWRSTERFDIKNALRTGENEVLVRVDNFQVWAGLLAEIYLQMSPQMSEWILTDDAWKYVVSNSEKRPAVSEFRDKAIVIGPPPVLPWGESIGYKDLTQPIVKESVEISPHQKNISKELSTARIRGVGKRAYIEINGKIYPPLMFYTPFSTAKHPEAYEDNVVDMAARGIHIHLIAFEMREFWKGSGQYDFSTFDRTLNHMMKYDPEGWFIINIGLYAPDWWLRANPDEAMKYYGNVPRNPGKDFQSMTSKRWLEEMIEKLTVLIQHIKKQPYASRVIGMSPCSGQTWEWIWDMGHGHSKLLFSDYSPAALAAYRGWLRKRYDNDNENLRTAWRKPDIDFENVQIPVPEERTKSSHLYFQDPLHDRFLIDYWLFRNESTANNIITLCKAIKEQTEGRWLTGTYYGYLTMFSYLYHALQEGGHLALDLVLDSPYIDYLKCPALYMWRRPGLANYSMMPLEALSSRGKMLILECDQRTFTESCDTQWKAGRAETVGLTIGMLDRDFGLAITHGMGLHWYDMYGRWYREPVILETLRRQMEAYNRLPEEPSGLTPFEVCVVSCIRSPLYVRLNATNGIHSWLVAEPLRRLFEAGFAFNYVLVDDLLVKNRIPAHKLYIMQNTIVLTPEERGRLNERFAKENASVLWLYAPGAMTPDSKASSENASATVGIGLKMLEEERTMIMKTGVEWGEKVIKCMAKTGPWFVIDDKFVVVTGQSHDELPIFGYRQEGQRRIWFSAIPNLPPSLFRQIAEKAGVWIYSRTGDPLHIGNDLIFLHAKDNGEKQINLPFAAKLRPIVGPLRKSIRSGEIWTAKAGFTYGFLVEKLK
ncbi:MAG: hypothetical protein DDT31_00968 [Syntrophomonadaceae bacterium]|nr:hypothetical protein [Bacillota bacterium]